MPECKRLGADGPDCGCREGVCGLETRKEDATDHAAERLLDGCTIALQEFDTETLLAIADRRDEINPDGWMQKMIRQYVEVWR